MDIQGPDFSKLTERLLAPHRFVELLPEELINDGYAARLVPSHGGKKLICKHIDLSTLPTLDLAQAGIETDRRPQTILAAVEKLLNGRRFSIEPDFDFIVVEATLPLVPVSFDLTAKRMILEASIPFGPRNLNPKAEFEQLFRDMPQISFSLVAEGEPIPGLDISKSVRGFRLSIAGFLMPYSSLDQESVEAKAFEAAKTYCLAAINVGIAEKEYKEYIAENGEKWWSRLFNKKKQQEQNIAALKESLAAALSQANESLLALA